MTFTIHSSKDGNVQQTLRIGSRAAVDRAIALHDAGWDVYITDAVGRQYQPETFETLAARGPALPIADQMIPRANLETRIAVGVIDVAGATASTTIEATQTAVAGTIP